MLNALPQHSPFKWERLTISENFYKIPYIVSGQYDPEELAIINAAMNRIERNTCIRFEKRNNEEDFLDLQNKIGHGCYTTVGRLHGRNVLMLEANNMVTCIEYDIVIHELMHVIGLWHEHMRHDRGNYIRVRYDNIEPRFHPQFDMVPESESETFGIKYNYRSVMHYGKNAFSKTRRMVSIETLDPRYQDVIGKATDAAPSDYYRICAIYECEECLGMPFNLDVVRATTAAQLPTSSTLTISTPSLKPLTTYRPTTFRPNPSNRDLDIFESVISVFNRVWAGV
uniref:Metalloendopeptidase n=2 Tax=Ascaris TaxID=6251 RepID=A0A0M3HXD4_ASCLU